MISLIEKENSSNHKILKPDFNQKTGRELLAFFLQSKFKQILAHDNKAEIPVFKEIRPNFISRFSKRLINNPTKRILIGITGESACGKSTICKKINEVIEMLDLPISIMSTDNYFNDISHLIERFGTFDNLRDNGYDVDSPESFQLELLKQDLEKLSRGEDIKMPEYLLNGTGVSVPNSLPMNSNKIMVVEGMSTMYKDVHEVFDIKVYIEADNLERMARFFNRAQDRCQDAENAKKHWDYLAIAGAKHIQPFKSEADIIINGNSDLEYFGQIIEFIHATTNSFV